MAYERENESSFAQLVSGIVDDIRDLFRQEFALARHEVRQELAKARAAAIVLGASVAALGAGVVLILLAIGRAFAAWLGWPVWAGYGGLGILLVIIGGIAFMFGRSQLVEVKPVPEQTVKTVRENIEWGKNVLSNSADRAERAGGTRRA